jgi:hypothetical protein
MTAKQKLIVKNLRSELEVLHDSYIFELAGAGCYLDTVPKAQTPEDILASQLNTLWTIIIELESIED